MSNFFTKKIEILPSYLAVTDVAPVYSSKALRWTILFSPIFWSIVLYRNLIAFGYEKVAKIQLLITCIVVFGVVFFHVNGVASLLGLIAYYVFKNCNDTITRDNVIKATYNNKRIFLDILYSILIVFGLAIIAVFVSKI